MSAKKLDTLLSAVALALMSVSCTHPPEPKILAPQPPRPWTGLTKDVRAVWSAEPNIDLVKGPAVVVRAYVESYFLAMNMGTAAVVYPGFTRAVAQGAPRSDPFSDLWPETSHPVPYPLVGTQKRHVLRLDATGKSVVAIVCDFSSYTSGFDEGNGTFGYPTGAMDDGVTVEQVTMTAPESASTPIGPQRGPAPAPTEDVFGGWRVDSMKLDLANHTDWPTMTADVEACRSLAPDPIERRKALRNGLHPRSDYPTLPPYPGWPEAGPA